MENGDERYNHRNYRRKDQRQGECQLLHAHRTSQAAQTIANQTGEYLHHEVRKGGVMYTEIVKSFTEQIPSKVVSDEQLEKPRRDERNQQQFH